MNRFIDKLSRISRTEAQPIGFRARQTTSPQPKIQLVASLSDMSLERLVDYVAGADAGLMRISKPGSDARTLQKVCQTVADIPWGGWLQGSGLEGTKELTRGGCDFVVFAANSTPLALLQKDEVGKILEVEMSLSEGLLRVANELPIDAVLITGEESESYFLTWRHLMLFQRFADLLTKPLLVLVPPKVSEGELQALWQAGIDGVVVAVTVEQPPDRLKELRQAIDKLPSPTPRKREKREPLLPHTSGEQGMTTAEEDEEEEE